MKKRDKNFFDWDIRLLTEAFASAESPAECEAFLRDLCSNTEIELMAQRFHVARLLQERAPYSEIVNETDASTSTISEVKSSLENGTGGYLRATARCRGKMEGAV